MRLLDEFRDRDTALNLAAEIARQVDPGRSYRFMEFCGGHTHAIFRHGLQALMPENLRFLHGPGCPVCVLPAARIEMAIALAQRPGVTLCTYGDVMRVPARAGESLMRAKAGGADIRMVYSVSDALDLARRLPEREVVFLAVGFETSTPPTAVAVQQAAAEGLNNLSILCNHLLTPAAIAFVLGDDTGAPGHRIDGFLGPSHVSAIIGSKPYERVATHHRRPVVVAGFEPLDILQATLMLVQQINSGRTEVENQYRRVVTRDGNLKAQELMASVFQASAVSEWRGLGAVPQSGLSLRPEFSAFDAEARFGLREQRLHDVKGCDCSAILRGVKQPTDCKLFGRVCTPDTPRGACMVSSEGACAAYWSYGRHALPDTTRLREDA